MLNNSIKIVQMFTLQILWINSWNLSKSCSVKIDFYHVLNTEWNLLDDENSLRGFLVK